MLSGDQVEQVEGDPELMVTGAGVVDLPQPESGLELFFSFFHGWATRFVEWPWK